MSINFVSPQMEISLELGNMTRVQEFILLGLSTSPETREVLFAVFLTLYLLTLLENALIVFLVCSHTELHKPMYFFLGNLSCLEMCYVSVTMPSLLVGLWTGPYHVPFPACPIQLFLFVSLISTKCTLLASMACDRYAAICRPLHYPLLMRPQVCLGLAWTSWLGGLMCSPDSPHAGIPHSCLTSGLETLVARELVPASLTAVTISISTFSIGVLMMVMVTVMMRKRRRTMVK